MAGTSDPVKVDSDNMLTPKRQKEINDILDLLQQYRPTKIFIENTPSRQAHWDSLYVLAEQGILPNDARVGSESYQLGTKLAQRLKSPNMVVCVDWQPDDVTNTSTFDVFYKTYLNAFMSSKPYKSIMDSSDIVWSDNARAVIADFQKIYVDVAKLPVKEALLLLNSPAIQKKYYYINDVAIMDKNVHDYGVTGASSFMIRNLNIYANIIKNIAPSDQRIMILYGAGHTEALRHMFEGNPRTKLVSFAEVVK